MIARVLCSPQQPSMLLWLHLASKIRRIALVLATLVCLTSMQAEDLEIPFEKFVLDNGLTLIVHEDHKAPIAAVNVWYHVGSKNEKPGKTGFAHLFEHLMFNGSEHYNDDYFKPLEKVGATDMNGTTSTDRTNYFQNVPTSALDLALWMESDRMGHMLGAIDQAKLDEQRGVVQNEKRQGENHPYGKVHELITENTYPKGHPYSWTVIGSMEDLDAASLEDVQEWFKNYYGAANAIVAVAGDVDPNTVRARVEHYFGDIASGPPVPRQKAWIAKMKGAHRQTLEDRVPQARIYKVWNVPEWGSADSDYLDLASDVLGQGKNSRLYKRLVYEDQIATEISAYISRRPVGGQFYVQATAQPGVSLETIEAALDEELDRFIKGGPTEDEVRRVKTQYRARFIRGIERIGGFGGKSDMLASNEVYGGRPDFYKTTLERIAGATPDDLHEAAKRWLSDGVYILEVHPFPEFSSKTEGADRSKLPDVAEPPGLKWPDLGKASLSNGLKVVVAERHEAPIVEFELLIDAGYAADQFASPGLARLAMDMLDEGTSTRSSLEISEELAKLGARLRTSSGLDSSIVTLSALKENLGPSLAIFADVILNPVFPESDLERLRKQRLARIAQEKTDPFSIGWRLLPGILFGKNHAYGNPLTGSGTEASVRAIARSDLEKFHQTWFQPDNATLIIVGDTTLDEIIPKLESNLKGWQDRTEPPAKDVGAVSNPEQSVLYLVDRPGAGQSSIIGGLIAPPLNTPDRLAIESMNRILGGSFTSRINMNLREDKHWSYGSRSRLTDAKGQRLFLVTAPVQTDKTKESMVELDKELRGILGPRPASEEELEKTKKNQILKLPGLLETKSALRGAISEIIEFGLPEDEWARRAENITRLELGDISAAAEKVVQPGRIVWIVVGDRAKIEGGLRELDFGEIRLIDTDGEPVG